MRKIPKTEKLPPPPNLKEQNSIHSFRVKVRDREHFYKIVNWLNLNVGKGTEYWTMEGHVLRAIRDGVTVAPLIYIFKEDFDVSSSVYLSLI